jgi:hypothetical protein
MRPEHRMLHFGDGIASDDSSDGQRSQQHSKTLIGPNYTA